jgi:hypothetical protein
MRCLALKVGALLLAAVAAGAAAPGPEDALLQALNQSCLDAYSAGRAQFIASPGPLIIVGSDLTFIANGQETHADYTPGLYTVLKTLSHPYLGTIVLLEPFARDPAAHQDVWRPHLEAMRRETAAVMPHLGELGLDADSLTRNRFILERMLAFMDGALAKGSYAESDLAALGHELGPLLLANATIAARAQIDMMKAAVDHWRAQVGEAAWSRVLVVIEGPHQPRVDNLQATFFRFALGARAPTQLVYAENVFDRKSAMQLVGTVEADRGLSILTFDDPLRMQRDLLGDAAEAYLLQMYGKLGQPLP